MSDPDSEAPDETLIERTVDPESEEPNYLVLETISEIEDIDVTTMPPMYERIDHILEELFSDPPESAAQVEISFSYHGYRITITQGGTVILRKLDGELDEASS